MRLTTALARPKACAFRPRPSSLCPADSVVTHSDVPVSGRRRRVGREDVAKAGCRGDTGLGLPEVRTVLCLRPFLLLCVESGYVRSTLYGCRDQ